MLYTEWKHFATEISQSLILDLSEIRIEQCDTMQNICTNIPKRFLIFFIFFIPRFLLH